jgi:hypothetical protein
VTEASPRPRYETPQDRSNEHIAVAKFAAKFKLFVDWRNADTGQTILTNTAGQVVAYVETKYRNMPAFKYTTLNISMRKIEHAQRAWDMTGKPTLLLVQFVDKLMVVQLYPYPFNQPFQIVQWGRTDRGDPKDVEPAATIPMGIFREIR